MTVSLQVYMSEVHGGYFFFFSSNGNFAFVPFWLDMMLNGLKQKNIRFREHVCCLGVVGSQLSLCRKFDALKNNKFYSAVHNGT